MFPAEILWSKVPKVFLLSCYGPDDFSWIIFKISMLQSQLINVFAVHMVVEMQAHWRKKFLTLQTDPLPFKQIRGFHVDVIF